MNNIVIACMVCLSFSCMLSGGQQLGVRDPSLIGTWLINPKQSGSLGAAELFMTKMGSSGDAPQMSLVISANSILHRYRKSEVDSFEVVSQRGPAYPIIKDADGKEYYVIEYSYTVNTNVIPYEIDLSTVDGSRQSEGVYKLTDDVLAISVSGPASSTRPQDFVAKSDYTKSVIEAKRLMVTKTVNAQTEATPVPRFLQGDWVVPSTSPYQAVITLRISENNVIFRTHKDFNMGDVWDENGAQKIVKDQDGREYFEGRPFSVALHTNTIPWQIDLWRRADNGTLVEEKGIFSLQDNTLTISIGKGGAPRAMSFDAPGLGGAYSIMKATRTEQPEPANARHEEVSIRPRPIASAKSTQSEAKSLPPFHENLSGANEVRVRNPNDFSVKTGIRSGLKGVDLDVPANSTRSAYIPNGRYDIYFIYSDKADALFQGDSFHLSDNGIEIHIAKVVNGNYNIRQVR